jgi:hypothetical protein
MLLLEVATSQRTEIFMIMALKTPGLTEKGGSKCAEQGPTWRRNVCLHMRLQTRSNTEYSKMINKWHDMQER